MHPHGRPSRWTDLAVEAGDPLLADVLATIGRSPIAATSLAVLLREPSPSVDAGIASESAVYSLLQAGPEFTRWSADRRAAPSPATPGPVVLTDRVGDELTVTLNRPQRHNAFDTSMRDGLSEALQLALADTTIDRVVLRGAGPSFCSGGDVATFGSFGDPATAHVVRLTRSPARLAAHLAARLGDRFEVRLQGACMGAGIELAAFARRIVAHPETRISLPEVALGLIPGAGGTVSIPARIGRQRALLLALCGRPIDSATALDWGLIDAVDDTP